MAKSRYFATAAAVGDKIYVAGRKKASLECYTATSKTWSLIMFQTPLYDNAVVSQDGQLYIL
jgi:hypothetical protein